MACQRWPRRRFGLTLALAERKKGRGRGGCPPHDDPTIYARSPATGRLARNRLPHAFSQIFNDFSSALRRLLRVRHSLNVKNSDLYKPEGATSPQQNFNKKFCRNISHTENTTLKSIGKTTCRTLFPVLVFSPATFYQRRTPAHGHPVSLVPIGFQKPTGPRQRLFNG